MAREAALIKKGRRVKLLNCFFNMSLSWIKLVASISSWKVKEGMFKASVMVLVIAFFIPVIFLTL